MSDPKAMQVAAEVRALSDRQTGAGVHTSSVAGAMIAEAARLWTIDDVCGVSREAYAPTVPRARCHGSRGASARPERGGVVTGPEWQAELVRLAMEALGTGPIGEEAVRAALRERMAQAAQAIVIEIEEARGAESARIDRIDATARALYAASLPIAATVAAGASAADLIAQGAYLHAELLENARAEWLAKRGSR